MFSNRYKSFLTNSIIVTAATVSLISGPTHSAVGATGQRVGIAAAVNPATNGTPPGGADRVIAVGSKLLQNERIVTTGKGRTQLLFLDGSALTIGPNSDVVLDEFVYDPSTKTGKLAFSATKGLFRLVGGKISKKTAVTFTTPTAVIGIRGGIGIITVRNVSKQAALGIERNRIENGLAAGSDGDPRQVPTSTGVLRLAQAAPPARVVTTAQLAFGKMTVKSGGVTRAINIPGFQVVAANPQQAPSQPARAEGKADGLSGLEGAGGNSTGGAVEAPTNEDVADTQISNLGSNLQPQTIVSAPPAGVAPPPPPPGKDPSATQKLASHAGDSTIVAQQNTTLDATAGTEDGVRLTGINNNFIYGGRYLSQTPFTAFDFSNNRTTAVVLRNNRGSGAQISNGFLSINSSSDGLTFKLPVKNGDFSFASGEGNTRFGAVSGKGYGAPDESFFYFNLRESNFNNNPSSVFAGVPFTGSFPTAGIRAHDLLAGFPGNSLIPMLPLQFGGDLGGRPRSILYSAYSSNLINFVGDARSVALYGSIAIEGVGANQRSAQIVYMGTYFGDAASNNKIVLAGYSRGSVRSSATGLPIRINNGGAATSRDIFGNSFFGIGGPDHFVIGSDFTSGGVTTLLDGAGFVQALDNNTSTPDLAFFTESYTRPTAVPDGVGVSRTSQTLNGYTSGLVTAKTSTSTFPVYIAQNLNATPNSFKIVTNASTNRLYATFKTEDANAARASLVVPLGNPSGNGRSRQAFIDDNIFGVRDSTSLSPTFGGASGSSRIVLVTSAFTELSDSLASGINFCACKFTKWGFISGEVRKDASVARHRFHLVPWVAGRLSGPSVTAAQTGTASYTGHVAANIKDGANQYVAFGNYNQSWDFSARSGSATISNLDGASYTGSIGGVSGSQGSQFVGSISGAGRSGSLRGAFMEGASSNVGEVGAEFHVVGGAYTAAGVAIAKQP
jgi:hypothetical protein